MEFHDHHHGMHTMDHHHHHDSVAMAMAGDADASSSSSSHLLCDDDMGMIMYMDGFRWTLKGDASCLNFLIPSWKLNTVLKFLACMLCVVAMGIGTEGINRWKHTVFQQRRNHRNSNPNATTKLALLHTGLQGLSILSAYLLMLVVMTYSLELLLCVIVGLMIGHYVFDGDSLQKGGGTLCCNFLEGTDDSASMTDPLLPRNPSSGEDAHNGLGSTRTTSEAAVPAGDVEYSCCNNDGGQNEEQVI